MDSKISPANISNCKLFLSSELLNEATFLGLCKVEARF